MSYLALVSITPVVKDESVSKYMAKAFKVIESSGLPYQLTSMGTIVESQDLDEMLRVIKKAIESLEEESNRVSVIRSIAEKIKIIE
ncbi:MAG: MTH1187 family thiamine-binding protein [bacterium]